jgi:hypothetical protein
MLRKLVVLGAGLAMIAGAAQAQPIGHSWGPGEYAYVYAPPRAYGYDGRYTPFSFYNGVDYAELAARRAPMGPELRAGYGPGVRLDAYGPNPNGMIAPDGHQVRCRLSSHFDIWKGHTETQRECW